jgi:hypothetical protein
MAKKPRHSKERRRNPLSSVSRTVKKESPEPPKKSSRETLPDTSSIPWLKTGTKG